MTVGASVAGLVMAAVEPGASGAKQGVEVGDRVVGLNGVPISPTATLAEFAALLKACRPAPSVPAVIRFIRQGKDLVTAQLQRQRRHGRPGADDPDPWQQPRGGADPPR